MYRFFTVCRRTTHLHSTRLNRQCHSSILRQNRLMTMQSCYLSTAGKCPSKTGRRQSLLGQRSSSVLNTCTVVRHAHNKLIDMKMLKLPKKLISWAKRMKLYFKLGDKFDVEEFFKGVRGSFVYASECIAKGDTDGLRGLLTDEANEDMMQYITDAQTNNRHIYLMTEDDVVLMKVMAVGFHEAEWGDFGNVTVLTMNVWIAYMKDCLKTLEENNPALDASISEISSNFMEMQTKMQELSLHAEFEYQRAYDEKQGGALSDWFISKVTYKLPKRSVV